MHLNLLRQGSHLTPGKVIRIQVSVLTPSADGRTSADLESLRELSVREISDCHNRETVQIEIMGQSALLKGFN